MLRKRSIQKFVQRPFITACGQHCLSTSDDLATQAVTLFILSSKKTSHADQSSSKATGPKHHWLPCNRHTWLLASCCDLCASAFRQQQSLVNLYCYIPYANKYDAKAASELSDQWCNLLYCSTPLLWDSSRRGVRSTADPQATFESYQWQVRHGIEM